MLNIGVLVSGGGTNLQKLIDAQAAGQIVNGQLRVVIASRPDAYALERAKKAGIEAITLRRKDYGSVEEYSQSLIEDVYKRQGPGSLWTVHQGVPPRTGARRQDLCDAAHDLG